MVRLTATCIYRRLINYKWTVVTVSHMLHVRNEFTCVTGSSRPSSLTGNTSTILYVTCVVFAVGGTWFVAVNTVNVGSNTAWNDKVQWKKRFRIYSEMWNNLKWIKGLKRIYYTDIFQYHVCSRVTFHMHIWF